CRAQRSTCEGDPDCSYTRAPVVNPAADLLQETGAMNGLPVETPPCDKERSAMPHPRDSSAEIVQRGQGLYDQQIRAHVEASHPGKFRSDRDFSSVFALAS